jgi:hypothetical protein
MRSVGRALRKVIPTDDHLYMTSRGFQVVLPEPRILAVASFILRSFWVAVEEADRFFFSCRGELPHVISMEGGLCLPRILTSAEPVTGSSPMPQGLGTGGLSSTSKRYAESLTPLESRRHWELRHCSLVCSIPGQRSRVASLMERYGCASLSQLFDVMPWLLIRSLYEIAEPHVQISWRRR